jgi:hypothetical protein
LIASHLIASHLIYTLYYDTCNTTTRISCSNNKECFSNNGESSSIIVKIVSTLKKDPIVVSYSRSGLLYKSNAIFMSPIKFRRRGIVLKCNLLCFYYIYHPEVYCYWVLATVLYLLKKFFKKF